MLVEGLDKKLESDCAVGARAMIPAAITDTGCERELNEDRYAVIESSSGTAWLVCDGMGGVTGGELAAQLAIDAIRRDLENLPARPPDVALKSAILEANRIIVLRRQNQAFSGMGTTIVAALFCDDEVVVGHVGDSRAYLVRDRAIQQLTTDHTYVQKLVEQGEIRSEDALSHPQAHILTRAIGSEPGLEVNLERFWVCPVGADEPSDLLILCTDGLYSLASEGEIANIVCENVPQRACVRLVELVKARGGYDNITVAVIPLGGQMKREPPPGQARRLRVRQRPKTMPRRSATFGFLKTAGIIIVLAMLAAVLTVFATIFTLLK